MFKNKLSLQVFAATISKSISNANEMLQAEHKLAVKKVTEDELGVLMPPPQPLMIQNVKVKFKANVSRGDIDHNHFDLLIDLSKPDGNFNGELEFVPFSSELLRNARNPGDGNKPFPARPARPPISPPPPMHPAPPPAGQPMPPPPAHQEPQPFIAQDDATSAPAQDGENTVQGAYDRSDTPRNYSIDI